MADADIGLIGLAVMGRNLVLNMSDHGFRVAVYNRGRDKTEAFLAGAAKGRDIDACFSLEELHAALARPRRIMFMVRAGEPVDELIEALLPGLEAGDVLIDGGNSLFSDTARRCEYLSAKGIHYIGTGISGGEQGARHGPSIMPGGNAEAWPSVQAIFQSIAAQVDGEPCCDWVGEAGAGHFVKMVHNGIEYGDMQIICEAYDLLHRGLGVAHDRLGEIFTAWNRGPLESYLIEITADILGFREAEGGILLDKILDAAGQKGTGKWTAINSLQLGVPLSLIGEAVFARNLSSMKEERERAARRLDGPQATFTGDVDAMLADVHDALYASKIVSYAQGFMLLREAAREYGWHLNYGALARIWRGGCIIRSRFLNDIHAAYETRADLENLLLDDFFSEALAKAQAGWRRALGCAISLGIPTPAFGAALSFYDGYRSQTLPANLLQAQRDYFGAHGYERVDKPRGEFFHSDWTGQGGDVSSSHYSV